jgi:hypothetical protein
MQAGGPAGQCPQPSGPVCFVEQLSLQTGQMFYDFVAWLPVESELPLCHMEEAEL